MSFITGILQLLLTLSAQSSLSRKYAQINKNCEPARKTLRFWNGSETRPVGYDAGGGRTKTAAQPWRGADGPGGI